MKHFESVIIPKRITKQPFKIILSDIQFHKKPFPTFELYKDDIRVDFEMFKDGTIRILETDSYILNLFKYSKEAVQFLQKYKEPIMMRYHQEIDTFQLGDIIKLVERRQCDLKQAIEYVLNDF